MAISSLQDPSYIALKHTYDISDLLTPLTGKISLDLVEIILENNTQAIRIRFNAKAYLSCGSVLKYVAEKLPNLSEFFLKTEKPYNNNIRDEDLNDFALTAQKVTKLRLFGCSFITSEGLLHFIKTCRPLDEFSTDLSCFNDTHLFALFEHHHIRVLNIRGDNHLGVPSVNKVSEYAENITWCSITFHDILFQSEYDQIVQRIKTKNSAAQVILYENPEDPQNSSIFSFS